MPEDKNSTPLFVKKCVNAVASKNGGDVDKAFAICVSKFQKDGYIKKGTMEPTKKGKKLSKKHSKDPDVEDKLGKYEKLLSKAKEKRSKRAEGLAFDNSTFRPTMYQRIDSLLTEEV